MRPFLLSLVLGLWTISLTAADWSFWRGPTQNGVSPAAAGASAFRTVVQAKLRPGDFYQDAGGAWVKK